MQQVFDAVLDDLAKVAAVVMVYLAISFLRSLRDWARAKHHETLEKVCDLGSRYMERRVDVVVAAVEQRSKVSGATGEEKLEQALSLLAQEGSPADPHDVEAAVHRLNSWPLTGDCVHA